MRKVTATIAIVRITDNAYGYEIRSANTGRLLYTSLASPGGYSLTADLADANGRLMAEHFGNPIATSR